MIECVNISNVHLYSNNPLAAQFALRHQCIVERQGWEVPTFKQFEYDTYDNPCTEYLVWRDEKKAVRGVSRLYPTDRPYMLEEIFADLIEDQNIPKSHKIMEGSRFCVDQTLPPEVRKTIIKELVIAYLEYGLEKNIDAFVGVMYPAYWRNIFLKSGWDVTWLGDVKKCADGNRVRAGKVLVSEQNLQKVREVTGITETILTDQYDSEQNLKKAA